MGAHFTQSRVPADAWGLAAQLSGGIITETVSILTLHSAQVVHYADGSPSDTLPANTPAAVFGGGAVFDPTVYVWLPYVVLGSATLSLIKEADLGSLTGDYAVLARIVEGVAHPYQQSGAGSGVGAFVWVTKTADYALTTDDSGILIDATSNDVTLTLPVAVGIRQLFACKRKDATSHVAKVVVASSGTIDGFTTAVLPTKNQSYVFGSDNAEYYVHSAYYPSPLTTKGDLIVADANALPQRLGVGTDTDRVTANSAATYGVDYEP